MELLKFNFANRPVRRGFLEQILNFSTVNCFFNPEKLCVVFKKIAELDSNEVESDSSSVVPSSAPRFASCQLALVPVLYRFALFVLFNN